VVKVWELRHILAKNKKLKVKNQNDKPKRKNVVGGFSLVPGQDRTTLKGRTTIVSGISPTGLLLKTEEFAFCISYCSV
jgi:hypothetical protein